jgi:hypothetical protein
MSVQPVRLRLSRKKGFDLQAHSLATNGLPAVNVARPSKWGNPFVVHHPHGPKELRLPMSADIATTAFRSMIANEGGWFPVPLPWPKGKIPSQFTTVEDVRRELRGKNLACWCSGSPCHADVLLEIANAPVCEGVPA